MSKDSTLGLSPEKLARLLGIALDSGEGRDKSAHTIAQLLNACLSGMLPFDTTAKGELPVILCQLFKELVPHGARTLGEALTDPKSGLDTIKKIRQDAKRIASGKGLGAEQVVATTIYFAAIASALVFHNEKITTHSYESLETSFDKLIKKPWMSAELTKLFTTAREICRRKNHK